jgi:predicted metal-dependent HD superfamily phosphohydrolase
MDLKRRWLAFCRRAGAKPGMEAGAAGRGEEAFAELDRRYREPGRRYHTWRHVTACLRELWRARPPAGDALGLEMAVWFHDAVYVPGRPDNEEASAELARDWAARLGLAPELGRRAARLILSTRHLPAGAGADGGVPAAPGANAAEELLQDIDLAVLGAGWARYLRYERSIAREHAGLEPAAFREGRAKLLRGFLARPALYATPGFRRRLERRARRNLARSIARLAGRPPARREGG